MLVLTRKMGEEIRIGDDIVVKITGIQGGRVRVGVNAPREMKIVRSETIEVDVASELCAESTRQSGSSVSHASALH